jgi:uncharacterized membrane protein
MTDQRLAARMAASLAAALRLRSATIEAANETTNQAGKDQKMKKAGAEVADGAMRKSYGLILKGRNELVAAAGVTGASAARRDGSRQVRSFAP